MEDNSSTATNQTQATGASDAPSYVTQNDLDFEMTPEQEQAFINDTLGIASATSEDGDAETTNPAENEDKIELDGEQPDSNEVPETDKLKPGDDEQGQADKTTEPAQIKTDDLWVEVEKVAVDDDGNKTVEKVKLVYDPEDPASFVPDDFKFANDKQLAEILEAKLEMASIYKERKAKFDSESEALEQSKSAEQAKADQLASWDAEVAELIAAGTLDEPKVKSDDPGFKDDPAVQRISSVFKFMTDENEKRLKDGGNPIKTFGVAYNLFVKQEAAAAEEAAQKHDVETAKAKGALIGGSSAASGASSRPYMAGSASSIWDVPVE